MVTASSNNEPSGSDVIIDHEYMMFKAAESGNVDALIYALSQPNVDVNAIVERGYTALMIAAEKDHTACINHLLKVRGIDVNKLSHTHYRHGYTALMIAALKGHVMSVRALLTASDIDVNLRVDNEYGFYNVLELVVSEAYDVQPDYQYTEHTAKAEEVVAELLRVPNMEVNQVTSVSALQWMASAGMFDSIRRMLRYPGVDIEYADINGETFDYFWRNRDFHLGTSDRQRMIARVVKARWIAAVKTYQRRRATERMRVIEQELMAVCWHPSRVIRYGGVESLDEM